MSDEKRLDGVNIMAEADGTVVIRIPPQLAFPIKVQDSAEAVITIARRVAQECAARRIPYDMCATVFARAVDAMIARA